MSKKTSEKQGRAPRAKPRTKPKAPASQEIAETTALTAEQILAQLRSGQGIDSESWKGYAVEVRDGKVFISKKTGCVTKKLVDGAPLRPAAEKPTEAATNSGPDSATQTPAPATETPVLAATTLAAPAETAVPAAATPAPAPQRRPTPPPRPAVAANGNGNNASAMPAPAPKQLAPAASPANRTSTPPLGSPAVPAEPKVVVPAMEAPTMVIPVSTETGQNLNTPSNVLILADKTDKLRISVGNLIKQADALLKNGKLESGADIPTIIINFEDHQQNRDKLERFYASTLSDKERQSPLAAQAIKDIRELKGKIDEKLLALRTKQGEEEEEARQMAVIQEAHRKDIIRTRLCYATAIAVIIGGGALVVKKCSSDHDATSAAEQPNVTAPASPDVSQTGTALPPEMPLPQMQEQTPPPAPAATDAAAKKTTATPFNCTIDTTAAAQIKCVNPNAPADADIKEKLAWVGEYNSETQTVPAKVTLVTPDGKQFEVTFDAQIGTRQELSFALEAQPQ
ncbi:hypothetical protein HZC21_00320 [Candidatus Peregrinibacteria bacterium]|nr:hypothetical protein [Candidatus Peregrinibacteria bacterium]